MDLIRSSIEALFYHLPPEAWVEHMQAKQTSKNEERLINRLVEIASRNNEHFTSSEMELLGEIIVSEWLTDNEISFLDPKHSKDIPLTRRLPVISLEFSREVLVEDSQGNPIVKFEHLLRWRELSLTLGEDMLALPYLARLDFSRKKERNRFLWPNILEHDNFRLNAFLNEELSDTHSHVHAAHDVFEFNWLGLMNYPEQVLKNLKSDDFPRDGKRMEYDSTSRFSNINFTLKEWIAWAAAIRVYLFQLISSEDVANRKRNRPEIFPKDIYKLLSIESEMIKLLEATQGEIDRCKAQALPTDGDGGIILDYAIPRSDFADSIPKSPYMVHHGERRLLYRWYHQYFSGKKEVKESAPLLILYLILKVKIRREFLQVNSLIGFSNFQTYQNQKSRFVEMISEKNGFSDIVKQKFRDIIFRYAVQSSIGEPPIHHLEARVTPHSVEDLRKADFHKPIFGVGQEVAAREEKMKNLVSVVAHFIKRPHLNDPVDGTRHGDLRQQLWEQSRLLKENFDLYGNAAPPLVGLDAASSELACRPEVFAPMFRYARMWGLRNFTFHAGEDFYDIVDGLRTIHETLMFMEYTTGCRIGHGLALGVDAPGYYSARHNNVILPAQILLDNMVWMKYFAAEHNITLSAGTVLLIEENYAELITRLGFANKNNPVPMWDYWQSMLLRGDMINASDESLRSLPEIVKYSRVSPHKGASSLTHSLYDHYIYDKTCLVRGEEAQVLKLPESFGQDVRKLQDALLDLLEQKGIVIETNPSSNLKIGRFSRYDQHPITIFHDVAGESPRRSMVVTINTDDKGVFATSLKNEYSLMAIALQKMRDSNGNRRWSDLQIEQYLRRIAHYGNISRFQSGMTSSTC